MKTQDKNSWADTMTSFGLGLGIMGVITVELLKPEFANAMGHAVFATLMAIIGAIVGGLIDRALSFKRMLDEPKIFVNHLADYASGEVRAVMERHLTARANAVLAACEDSIKFQQEEISGTGRAAGWLLARDIEATRAEIDRRVAEAKDDFYGAYDIFAPFADAFTLTKRRSFKEFATRDNQVA